MNGHCVDEIRRAILWYSVSHNTKVLREVLASIRQRYGAEVYRDCFTVCELELMQESEERFLREAGEVEHTLVEVEKKKVMGERVEPVPRDDLRKVRGESPAKVLFDLRGKIISGKKH